MKKEFVSSEQLKLLPERLRKARESNASKELNFYLWHLYERNNFKPMRIMVVGTGGSYPAAIFARHIIQGELTTPYVEACTPQSAIKIINQFNFASSYESVTPKYNLVIGISYSGKTPDIKNLSNLCLEKKINFLLLTGSYTSELSSIYPENNLIRIISYFSTEDYTGKEKGMISMFSTLAPITVFQDSWAYETNSANQNRLKKAKNFVEKLDVSEISLAIKKAPCIHVFYEWDTYPIAADIESKFTESGIAHVILHEKKNFSHGRFTSILNQNFAFVINLVRYDITKLAPSIGCQKVYRTDYDAKLANFLIDFCKEKSKHYLELSSAAVLPTRWNLDIFFVIPYFITKIGMELGIDISKPLKSIPDKVFELYNYEGNF